MNLIPQNAFGGGGSSIDLASPGAIGGTTPAAGTFTALAGASLTVTQGTLTDVATGLGLTATWNDAADTFRGLDITITDTASAAGSTPLRVMGGAAGTTTLLELSKAGVLTVANVISSSGYLDLVVGGFTRFGCGGNLNVSYQPMQFGEMSAPSAQANTASIWAEDNGSGKTRLMVIFGSGAAQQIAIEP